MEDSEFIMTTPEFVTNQVFSSRDELMNWVKNLATSLGVVVVTKRSNKYPNGVSHTSLLHFSGVFKYSNENWLDKYKKMFVSVWIDRHLNFGNNTTNRVESQHTVLKKYLKSTNSNLDKFVGRIDRLVQSQHTSIKESFEKSRIVRIHQHNLPCFKLLRGFVSNEALDIILANHRLVDSSNCDCRLRNSCGLPCSCELSMYISSGQCILLDSIDIFWRKLDFSPPTLAGQCILLPVITPYWNSHNISQYAVRWETMYRSRLDLYNQLCRRESGFIDVSD